MKHSLKTVLAGIALAGALFTAGAAAAQDIQSRNFKVAFVQNNDHPHGIGVKKFGELLEEKSGGKMKARGFGGGQLGGDAQVISSLQGGVLDMTLVSPGLLTGLVKEFSVFDLPFFFNDYREVDAVMDGPVGTRLLGCCRRRD
ncbi:TRAP transporter substrate-binding protein DctP [Skermanella pratensis]|uniref:TRAP transporter substrate-binding protein DctP n=1 Tax=Skermanella pratensis TaxID=2233999 RepID=UPI001B3B4B72|nr:TRAP transporter substrate-binding protein DctP [Skermanella pratensis]